MTNLFTPMALGDYQLPNRIIMAPLTRSRATESGTPVALMAEHYAQRASAGLIIAEATAVSRQGRGWMNTPGLYTDEQQAGWKQVADAVHAQHGRIFVQIWHMGATVHPDFLDGEQPVSSSNVALTGALATPKGRDRAFVEPRPLEQKEIRDIAHRFASTARRAIDAGLDGVEIHAANGFLIDQFIRDSTNQRSDEYGGSIDNRLRFMTDVIDAVVAEIGAGKVGIRLSPTNKVWGISDSDHRATFMRAVDVLNRYNLAYLHLLEPKPNSGHMLDTIDFMTPDIRATYQGTLLINGGYTHATGTHALHTHQGDAIVYGVPFIANPDLVERYQNSQPLNNADPDTFYRGGANGYTDYPRYADAPQDEHTSTEITS